MPNRAMLERIPDPAHGLFHPHVVGPAHPAPADQWDGTLRDEAFLTAFLPYVVALAKRHGEPVSLLCAATDRLAAIRELHGPALAEAAVRRVAEAMVRTLRASDVVARLDDGRLVAVLPFAGAIDLPMIAEAVRRAVADAGRATRTMPRLTATIGMSAYPDHASDAGALLASGLASLDRARAGGTDRAAGPGPSA